jgi:hypothetical protein
VIFGYEILDEDFVRTTDLARHFTIRRPLVQVIAEQERRSDAERSEGQPGAGGDRDMSYQLRQVWVLVNLMIATGSFFPI